MSAKEEIEWWPILIDAPHQVCLLGVGELQFGVNFGGTKFGGTKHTHTQSVRRLASLMPSGVQAIKRALRVQRETLFGLAFRLRESREEAEWSARFACTRRPFGPTSHSSGLAFGPRHLALPS